MFITSCSDTKDYKSYTLWHKTKTNKATGQTRYELEFSDTQDNLGVRNFRHPKFWHQDYKLYTIWHKTKTDKATGQVRCALESLKSQLSNLYLVCPVALLIFVLCQSVYVCNLWCQNMIL